MQHHITLKSLSERLCKYDIDEARSIIRTMVWDLFNMSFTDICAGELNRLNDNQVLLMESVMEKLEEGIPVQYATGKATFCDRVFHVETGVLIPRPETEELCSWISSNHKEPHLSVLDIGTGSGCIATTLALDMNNASVRAWDISDEALHIATNNARNMNANVTFERKDIIEHSSLQKDYEPLFDIIVSNPPYICTKEAAEMEDNVLEYEPHIALFVPDEDPLLFYKSITLYASNTLKPKGRLYFEINPLYSREVVELLNSNGFHNVEIKEDEFGKQRMISGQR